MELLKLKFPKEKYLHRAYGITDLRRTELTDKLDQMVKEATEGPPRYVYIHEIIAHIEKFCDTPEELIFCVFQHTWLLATNGRIPNFKTQYDAEKNAGESF
jgi:hypothetical protein